MLSSFDPIAGNRTRVVTLALLSPLDLKEENIVWACVQLWWILASPFPPKCFKMHMFLTFHPTLELKNTLAKLQYINLKDLTAICQTS